MHGLFTNAICEDIGINRQVHYGLDLVTREHDNGSSWHLWARMCIHGGHLITILTETNLPSI